LYAIPLLFFQLGCIFLLPGEDPLDGKVDGDDINSVAGLLKLYFRELKDSLFPASIFEQLVECSSKYNINGKLSAVSVMTSLFSYVVK